ncbi:MAG: hypothetical protein ACOYY3_16755, partial [Chloroflexota bacterium]
TPKKHSSMPFRKNFFHFRAGLNGTADKRGYSFLIGVIASLHAANAKIVRPHPRVLTGRPCVKVISNALYGLPPFSLLALYPRPTGWAVSWIKNDGDRP